MLHNTCIDPKPHRLHTPWVTGTGYPAFLQIRRMVREANKNPAALYTRFSSEPVKGSNTLLTAGGICGPIHSGGESDQHKNERNVTDAAHPGDSRGKHTEASMSSASTLADRGSNADAQGSQEVTPSVSIHPPAGADITSSGKSLTASMNHVEQSTLSAFQGSGGGDHRLTTMRLHRLQPLGDEELGEARPFNITEQSTSKSPSESVSQERLTKSGIFEEKPSLARPSTGKTGVDRILPSSRPQESLEGQTMSSSFEEQSLSARDNVIEPYLIPSLRDKLATYSIGSDGKLDIFRAARDGQVR